MVEERPRATGESWKDDRLAVEQLKVVDRQLVMLRRGSPPAVYVAAADALAAIPGSDGPLVLHPKDEVLTLLDVGCASGYYSEVISVLIGGRFEYTGCDYSDAMLAIARARYPGTRWLSLDVRCLALPNQSYDVVLCGAVIEHVKEWKVAIRELTRVAQSYLVLHRTPVTDGPSARIDRKIYGGVPVFYNTFNKRELTGLLKECGFRLRYEKDVYARDRRGPKRITRVWERVKKGVRRGADG